MAEPLSDPAAASRRRWLRRGRAALAGVVLSFAFLPLVEPHQLVVNSDWVVYMMAGRIFTSQPAQLYDGSVQRAVEESIAGGRLVPGLAPEGYVPFNQPAWVAAGGALFGVFGADVGGRAWILAVLIAACAGLFLLAGDQDRWKWLAAAAGVPMAILVLNGQTVGLVVLGLGAAWALWSRRRPVLAGLALGLCLHKPHLVIPLGLALLAAREWRVLGGWIIAGAALAAAITLRAPNLLIDWLRFSSALAGELTRELALPSLVYHLGLPANTASVLAAATTVVAAVVVVLIAARRRAQPATAMAILVAGGFLAAPHALGSDLVLLSAAGAVWPGTRWFDWLAISAASLVAVFQPGVVGTLVAVALAVAALVRMARAPTVAGGRHQALGASPPA